MPGGRSAHDLPRQRNRDLRLARRARCLWQSITLQQFIETTGPARQGIVIFFTIFLSPVYSPKARLSTAVFCFLTRGPDSAATSRARKEQNNFANRNSFVRLAIGARVDDASRSRRN